GEILWFKIYCVDATYHKSLDLSKVAYIELLDKNNKPVLKAKIDLENGLGDGSLYIPISSASGNYKLRAYTRWMRNGTPDFFFEQAISIVNSFTKPDLQEKNTTAYDIQFLPEGGNLLADVENRIACKVINDLGEGVNYSGIIINDSGDTLQYFRAHKFGMGSFLFTPKNSETYKALISVEEKI
ncbi:MAG: hypothetical protein AAGI07_13475, partial [Bacteroidota bacterium]